MLFLYMEFQFHKALSQSQKVSRWGSNSGLTDYESRYISLSHQSTNFNSFNSTFSIFKLIFEKICRIYVRSSEILHFSRKVFLYFVIINLAFYNYSVCISCFLVSFRFWKSYSYTVTFINIRSWKFI